MTYVGATAASSLANPPSRIAGGLGGINQQSTAAGGGRSLWMYNSSHASTDLVSASFFTDAYYLGMQAGDIVLCVSATASGSSALMVAGVLGAVTTAGANLSTGAFITSTFG